VNGKLRSRLTVPEGTDAREVESLARADAKVAAHLKDKRVRDTIHVPRKILNFVTS
jgi:leucyl-tRNA synthetase